MTIGPFTSVRRTAVPTLGGRSLKGHFRNSDTAACGGFNSECNSLVEVTFVNYAKGAANKQQQGIIRCVERRKFK